MKDMYTKKVLDHFRNPRNIGEIKDADGVGTVGNPVCGDVMTIYIKVKNDKIDDIKFKTYGCAAAISSTSIATEMVKGKTLDEALKLTRDDVVKRFLKHTREEIFNKKIEDCKLKPNDLYFYEGRYRKWSIIKNFLKSDIRNFHRLRSLF